MSTQGTETDRLFAGVDRVRAALDDWCERQRSPEGSEDLVEALRYSLLSGGKMLRPALAMRCCEAVGGNTADAVHAGASVEMIHAFSLVHDDLPAMDDDDLRRGRPTLHIHAGEAMAILAGDALATLAFGELVDQHADPVLACALIRELTRGTSGMIVGQVLDTLGEQEQQITETSVRRIHDQKTGALIAAACRMGALCGGASEDSDELARIDEYARAIGLMFQVVDDLIDVEQPPEVTGKRTGKDADAGKQTYPQAIGVARSRALVESLLETARGSANRLGESRQDTGSTRTLIEMAEYLAGRDR